MKSMCRLLLPIALLILATAALAAPEADLWDRWTAHDPQSSQRVDHGTWDDFLQRHVTQGRDGINRLPYGRIAPAHRQALDDYLKGLQDTPVSGLNRTEQEAFWINLYNALTVQVVLDHYPVESIRDIDISPGFFADGPWGAKLVRVEGEKLSLDDIEHRILRPIWQDPRIHYAVNCASLGCPNLQPRAFTTANLEDLLNRGARDYINHPRGASLDGGRLVVSSIYDWFQADFGGSEQGVIRHLRRYADPALEQQLQDIRNIYDDRYDWTLNDIR